MTGAELGAARLALGVTQAELGLLVGVHGVTICRWERSGRPVPAWVAGVVQAVLEGQTRQGGHLPRLADVALVEQAVGQHFLVIMLAEATRRSAAPRSGAAGQSGGASSAPWIASWIDHSWQKSLPFRGTETGC